MLVGTRLAAGERMLPFVELDAQAMLDDYHRHRHAVHAGWNACQGGEPKRVLACMVEGACPLRVAPARGYAWRGHPMRGDDESGGGGQGRGTPRRRGGGGGGRRGPRVASFRVVPNREADVRAALWERARWCSPSTPSASPRRTRAAWRTVRAAANHAVTVG